MSPDTFLNYFINKLQRGRVEEKETRRKTERARDPLSNRDTVTKCLIKRLLAAIVVVVGKTVIAAHRGNWLF